MIRTAAGRCHPLITGRNVRLIDRRAFLLLLASAGVVTRSIAASKRPVIFWFHTTEIEGSRRAPVSALEFEVLSADIPCHGGDSRPGEPSGLDGWRYRLERNEDLFGGFIATCRTKLDRHIETGNVDPSRIFVGGVSRGAYAAMMLSLADVRFHHVVGIAPLLTLNALTEFSGFTTPTPILGGASVLSRRSIFMTIEEGDKRVGAQHVVDLASAIQSINKDADIQTILLPGSEHTVTEAMTSRAAQWIADRVMKA